jgi:hypothetical protein
MNHKFYRETRKFIIAMGICLVAYILLSLCVSCSGSCEIKDDQGEGMKVSTFRYEHHRYLKFTDPFFPDRMGVIHDPECLKRDLKR